MFEIQKFVSLPLLGKLGPRQCFQKGFQPRNRAIYRETTQKWRGSKKNRILNLVSVCPACRHFTKHFHSEHSHYFTKMTDMYTWELTGASQKHFHSEHSPFLFWNNTWYSWIRSQGNNAKSALAQYSHYISQHDTCIHRLKLCKLTPKWSHNKHCPFLLTFMNSSTNNHAKSTLTTMRFMIQVFTPVCLTSKLGN